MHLEYSSDTPRLIKQEAIQKNTSGTSTLTHSSRIVIFILLLDFIFPVVFRANKNVVVDYFRVDLLHKLLVLVFS